MFISIIIPTLNRAASLKRTLNSLIKQQGNPDFEIIVVDNGSRDETSLIQLFLQQNFEKSQYHYNIMPGLLSCRHLGANRAKGDILVFFDDDVEINPQYLQSIEHIFSDENIALATGPCLPKYEIPPPAWLVYFWTKTDYGKYCGFLSLLDFGNKPIEIDPNFVWGLNFCIRKELLFDIEGFNPDTMPPSMQRFQGDGETGLTIKAKHKCIKAYYFPELTLFHHIAATRLTTDYLVKRSYFQGVCNSFTALREKHFYPQTTNNEVAQPSTLRKWRNAIHPYYRWIKPLFKKSEPTEIKELKLSIINSEQAGFDFHQGCFYSDDEVKNWVLLKNYLTVQYSFNEQIL